METGNFFTSIYFIFFNAFAILIVGGCMIAIAKTFRYDKEDKGIVPTPLDENRGAILNTFWAISVIYYFIAVIAFMFGNFTTGSIYFVCCTIWIWYPLLCQITTNQNYIGTITDIFTQKPCRLTSEGADTYLWGLSTFTGEVAGHGAEIDITDQAFRYTFILKLKSKDRLNFGLKVYFFLQWHKEEITEIRHYVDQTDPSRTGPKALLEEMDTYLNSVGQIVDSNFNLIDLVQNSKAKKSSTTGLYEDFQGKIRNLFIQKVKNCHVPIEVVEENPFTYDLILDPKFDELYSLPTEAKLKSEAAGVGLNTLTAIIKQNATDTDRDFEDVLEQLQIEDRKINKSVFENRGSGTTIAQVLQQTPTPSK